MLRPGDHVVSESIGDEVVMIDFKTGYYYRMTGSAARIWQVLASGATPDQVCECLASSPTRREEISGVVRSFIDQLRAEGVLGEGEAGEPADPDLSTAPQHVAPFGDHDAFPPPTFERFTDMSVILTTDPVHDVDPDKGWPATR